MVNFDSNEYWMENTWDRYEELNKFSSEVKKEFLKQEELTVNYVVELSKNVNHLNILDLACGTGKISESILKKLGDKVHITLVDINPNTLSIAKKHLSKYNNVDYVNMDVYNISNKFIESFDVVIALELIHHISQLNKLFNNIYMVLNKSGVFIANFFTTERYNKWDILKYGIIKSLKRKITHTFFNIIYKLTKNKKVKQNIKLKGYSRICPLNENFVFKELNPWFKIKIKKKTNYLWFVSQRLN